MPSKRKLKKFYMHLIDGRPACFHNNSEITQICYMHKIHVNYLAKSLKQIKKEQKKSLEWRNEQGYNHSMTYSYMIVTLP